MTVVDCEKEYEELMNIFKCSPNTKNLNPIIIYDGVQVEHPLQKE